MVTIVNRGLKQAATWWAATPNGSGGDTFAAPVLVTCRWSDRQEVFIGQIDRREQVSKAIVHVDRAVSVGDYLAIGDQTSFIDPTVVGVIDADKIQRFEKIHLRNLEVLYKAML